MLSLLWPWALALAPLPFVYRWLQKPAEINIRALRAPMLAAVAAVEPVSLKVTTWRNWLLMTLKSSTANYAKLLPLRRPAQRQRQLQASVRAEHEY
jgi:hypothetical protein